MAVAFDAATRELLDGRNFATVATLNPDGGPQTSVVWIRGWLEHERAQKTASR